MGGCGGHDRAGACIGAGLAAVAGARSTRAIGTLSSSFFSTEVIDAAGMTGAGAAAARCACS